MKKKGIHAGYEFEDGMFSRMRSWVDVAPWIRLARVLRILASPAYVGIIGLALLVTGLAFQIWFGITLAAERPLGDGIIPPDSWEPLFKAGVFRWVVFAVFLVLLWTPVLQLAYRAGASLCAGHGVPSIPSVFRKILIPRLRQSYLVPVIPWGCLLAIAMLTCLFRLPGLVVGEVALISTVSGWLIALVSIPMGILGFGALLAIPVGISSMVCEPDPGPIDSLSRGYEYLYRRPLSVAWYLAVAAALTWLAGQLIEGIGTAATASSGLICLTISPDNTQMMAAKGLIALIVVAWKVTFASALFGGVYLLLRHDAGGQEVEDFWSPAADPVVSLPELPEEAYES